MYGVPTLFLLSYQSKSTGIAARNAQSTPFVEKSLRLQVGFVGNTGKIVYFCSKQ